MMGLGMGLGLLLLLVISGGLIVGGMWLTRSVFGRGAPPPGSAAEGSRNSTKGILDQRYARGEITREEYERMRADLNL